MTRCTSSYCFLEQSKDGHLRFRSFLPAIHSTRPLFRSFQLMCLNAKRVLLSLPKTSPHSTSCKEWRHSGKYVQRCHQLYEAYSKDRYCKVELQRLRFIKSNQKKLRCNLYACAEDAAKAGR